MPFVIVIMIVNIYSLIKYVLLGIYYVPGIILDSYNIPANKFKSLLSVDHRLILRLLFAGYHAKPLYAFFYLTQKTILHR